MKKVRFESPAKGFNCINMNDTECHSPRPFIERHIPATATQQYNYPKPMLYTTDPLIRFECSDSSPYPLVNKTQLPTEESPKWSPSNDLDLSMLDASHHEPRRPMFCKSILKTEDNNTNVHFKKVPSQVLSSIENKVPPNVLTRNDDFFLRRNNLNKLNLDMNPLQKHLNRLSLDKENDPRSKKMEIMRSNMVNDENKPIQLESTYGNQCMLVQPNDNNCRCYNCIKTKSQGPFLNTPQENQVPFHSIPQNRNYVRNNIPRHCHCIIPPKPICVCCEKTLSHNQCVPPTSINADQFHTPKINAVDKKTWAIEKYEQSKKSDCMEVEKPTIITKEKREPTVSDLFKIIKLQNEQLQLLQEKVDKFISAQTQKQATPIENSTEHVSIETVDSEQHKISIGVMTSFEMVRTSTIINKEVLKSNDNAQIQCNKSQISIKEVVSKSPNSNFLEGIAPIGNIIQQGLERNGSIHPQEANEEKTFNELSLCNIQVDNATTPLMSPDQSLYLDVRDYSDSEAGSDDQSNVGWTYYNKVMTHVNGMLQDSDMPSSASALYRNTRQQMQTVQMHIDKTNVSVTKRVKFGDDPLGKHQPHIYAASTDTSLKMNQLAAKYLNNGPPIIAPPRPAPKPVAGPIDMSFATRNYMERHKLLQGVPSSSRSPPPCEMPRFLDITALKQQPKLL